MGHDSANRILFTVASSERELSMLLALGYTVYRLKSMPEILRTGRYRPAPAGVSIGNMEVSAGTLATPCTYNGAIMMLSNAHVFHPRPWESSGPDRYEITQPGPADGGTDQDVIGMYVKHAKIELNGSNCPVAASLSSLYNALAIALRRKTRLRAVVEAPNTVDCAIAEPASSEEISELVLKDPNTMIRPGYVSGIVFAGSVSDDLAIACKMRNVEEALGVKSRYPIKGPLINETVEISGRSTGWRTGKVISDNLTITVNYIQGFADFKDCIAIRTKIQGGDSGSIVYYP